MNKKLSSMPSRSVIKKHARQQFGANHWACVGVGFVALVIGVLLNLAVQQLPFSNPSYGVRLKVSQVGTYSLLKTAASLAVNLLVQGITGVLTIESAFFFLRVYRKESVKFGQFWQGLRSDFPRKLQGSFRRALFSFLWMLPYTAIWVAANYLFTSDPSLGAKYFWPTVLVSVPFYALAICKTLSYSMMHNILGDCPKVTARQAMRLSIRMMKGYRWQYVVFGLSFALWFLGGFATLFVLIVLSVAPYFSTALSGFYDELKRVSLANGVITKQELQAEDRKKR